jgi:hypothetical protein
MDDSRNLGFPRYGSKYGILDLETLQEQTQNIGLSVEKVV